MSASINELNLLTDEGEGGGEDEKHAVAVHGECDGKVSGQAAPNEKLVHCRPVMGVQTQLKNVILSTYKPKSTCNFIVIWQFDKYIYR